MATNQQLGAISWLNINLVKSDFLSIIIDGLLADFASSSKYAGVLDQLVLLNFIEDSKAIKTLQALTGVPVQELKRLGLEARRKGCFRDYAERTWDFIPGVATTVLRSVRSGWDHTDGTVAHHDDEHRYRFGPSWNNMSCALDSILFCAIQLNAGRTQIDQISPASLTALTEPARILRHISSSPWGTLEQGQRDRARDYLAESLVKVDSRRFGRGTYMAIYDVAEVVLSGLPQLSHTATKSGVCCDGVLGLAMERPITRDVGFHLPGHTTDRKSMEDVIRGLMTDSRHSSDREPCSNGDRCDRSRQSGLLILDRLPPILLLYLPDAVSKKEDQFRKCFTPQHISYRDTRGRSNVVYMPLGCVILLNGNHFVVRWMRGGSASAEILHYDGMKSPEVTVVRGWWDGLPTGNFVGMSANVVAVFLRQGSPENVVGDK